jgi:hypothetical protein
MSSDTLDAGLPDDARVTAPAPPISADPAPTVRVAPPRAAPERTLSPNPLWGIPLTQLYGTRDRPIFSPSRRPPPAAPAFTAEQAPVTAPVPQKELEPPPLSLVGTIASDDESYGIFLDQSTKAALRLKVGEEYQGWKLRTIQGREVTIERDQQRVSLTLPEPGAASSGDAHLLPLTAMPAVTDR